MSKNRKKKTEKSEESGERIPLMQRPRFNLIYSIIVTVLFATAIILIILSYSIESLGFVLFIALGILGVGIVLLTMRSSYKHTAPAEEEKKREDDDSIKMRNR
ncbi:MAG: hypothetical protein ACTSSG_03575 [Candidatus Heimdallarchaeaceae archaeon]